MLDDYLVRALLAGIGMALVAGPLGCFIVWRRLAYFGETLAHAALLGVALAFLLEVNVTFAVFAVAALIAVALLAMERRAGLAADSLLGILSHSSLALGIIVMSAMTWLRVDLMGLLFGDILSVSRLDIALIWAGGLAVLAVLALIWRGLFATTVSPELAAGEGVSTDRVNTVFMLLMAVVIAIAIKIVGVLLITAMLIIPAATARRFARSPEQMALLAAVFGVLAVSSGLAASRLWDPPSGPAIVVAALALFLISLTPLPGRLNPARRRAPQIPDHADAGEEQ
ncbi:metal ABC transporter permease [Pseudohoeflea coraliihabitans]|uniref:Metal ABC transporter permease n=1 Tax=Pseudohoeflea coraliihabitans TaxID=2860393 RepID=A0ABS6WMA6_9HYPH|nr:metal ABC transporter permease [Pseudohoeflea sp. DP4N28-3]MBW3097067.1 metal ABC transporter permease [Pseudohoeflea sp. DP4N28-3]